MTPELDERPQQPEWRQYVQPGVACALRRPCATGSEQETGGDPPRPGLPEPVPTTLERPVRHGWMVGGPRALCGPEGASRISPSTCQASGGTLSSNSRRPNVKHHAESYKRCVGPVGLEPTTYGLKGLRTQVADGRVRSLVVLEHAQTTSMRLRVKALATAPQLHQDCTTHGRVRATRLTLPTSNGGVGRRQSGCY